MEIMDSQAKKMKNKISTIKKALEPLRDGMVLMYGGFGGVGNPPSLIKSIVDSNVKDLVLIGNDASFPNIGIGRLVKEGRVKKLIASHIGSNPVAGSLMNAGKLEVEFSPQGILAERIRAGGMGLGGILTDVGIGTMVEKNKNTITIADKDFLIERPLRADVSIVYAKKADTFGNLIYDKSARNTNPLVAMAGSYTIAEAEEIVPAGELDPEMIVTPGLFIDKVVQSEGIDWTWAWE